MQKYISISAHGTSCEYTHPFAYALSTAFYPAYVIRKYTIAAAKIIRYTDSKREYSINSGHDDSEIIPVNYGEIGMVVSACEIPFLCDEVLLQFFLHLEMDDLCMVLPCCSTALLPFVLPNNYSRYKSELLHIFSSFTRNIKRLTVHEINNYRRSILLSRIYNPQLLMLFKLAASRTFVLRNYFFKLTSIVGSSV